MSTEVLFGAQYEEFISRVRGHRQSHGRAPAAQPSDGRLALRSPSKRAGASGSSRAPRIAWGGAGLASGETSLVVKDRALTEVPREADLIHLVKTVIRQEGRREATAMAERQEAMVTSFQRLNQEVQSESRARVLKEQEEKLERQKKSELKETQREEKRKAKEEQARLDREDAARDRAATQAAQAAQAEAIELLAKTVGMHSRIQMAPEGSELRTEALQGLQKEVDADIARKEAKMAAMLADIAEQKRTAAAAYSQPPPTGPSTSSTSLPEASSPEPSQAKRSRADTTPVDASPASQAATPPVRARQCSRCAGQHQWHECAGICVTCGQPTCLVGCEFLREAFDSRGDPRPLPAGTLPLEEPGPCLRAPYFELVPGNTRVSLASAELLHLPCYQPEFIARDDPIKEWARVLETSSFSRREEVDFCRLPAMVLRPAESGYMISELLEDEDGPPLPLGVKALHERVRLAFDNCLRGDSPFEQPLADWSDVRQTCSALAFITKCFVAALRDNMGIFGISRCAAVLNVQPLVHADAEVFRKAVLPAHGMEASLTARTVTELLVKEVSGTGNSSPAVAEVLLLCGGLHAIAETRPLLVASWSNPTCLPVLEGHAPSPFILNSLETGALRLIGDHSLWSVEDLLRSTGSAQPLAFTSFTLASVLATAFLSVVVRFEFLRAISAFTGEPTSLPEPADLPPLLKWWLVVLSNSPGGTPISADFLLPGYVSAELVAENPTYKILCSLHSGLRDALDHHRKSNHQYGHRGPIRLLRDIGWLQAVYPKYFFETGSHPRGDAIAPDFFLLNPHTICTLGYAAGFCTRPGKRVKPEELNLGAIATLQKIGKDLVPSLAETANSSTMFSVPLPDKSSGHWADVPELEHAMEAARLPRSLLLASLSVVHRHDDHAA